MSHVGNGEHDFDELNKMSLHPDAYENIKQAKIQARDIINRLEPNHITGFPELIMILRSCLSETIQYVEIHEKIEKI